MDYGCLRVESSDRLAVVAMARPPVNAVNQDMYREIWHLFRRSRQFTNTSAVILTGEGRHFCAGNDLHEFRTMTGENAAERMFHVREAFWSIYDCEVPVIAAVHGSAVGTGLALAASCDLIVASNEARFGLPELSVGVMGGAKHLSRLVPQGVVREMFLTAETMGADEMAAWGGIARVVPSNELMATATTLASAIARHSPLAIRVAKRALNAIEYRDLKSGYQLEQDLTGVMADTSDGKEALAALLEARVPVYDGT